MAFLQIAEPGLTAAPHQRKLAIGIDLGTTNSLVATVRSGEASTLPNEDGDHLLPSIVHYGEDSTVVGRLAESYLVTDPEDTLASIKRFLGRNVEDIVSENSRLPYRFKRQTGTPIMRTTMGDVNPVKVSSDILSTLKHRAERTLQDDIQGAVITVPAYFDDAQRQGTKDAAELAGLKVLRLLNEPTAAAIAYGLDSGQEGVVAVYDLGGGTFDVSILRLSKGIFEVLATGGDSALGGDDFDNLLVDFFIQSVGLTSLTATDNRALLNSAKLAKEAFASHSETTIHVTLHNGEEHQLSLNKTQFEGLVQPLINKTIKSTKRALKDAQVSVEDVHSVVLVGGSTRMLEVRDAITQLFSREPLTNIDPDRVVALGAALQADILVGNKSDSEMLLLDVLPLSLGLETMGGLTEKIIPRNATIPVARAQEFTTFKDGQTGMSLHVVQGERELISDCRSLAKFSLKNIPPMAAGAAHIRVTFQVDADGLLSVTAEEKTSGTRSEIQVKPSYGLTDEEVATMLKASFVNAKDDMSARMLREQQVEANRVVESLTAALRQDSELLELRLLEQLSNALEQLKQVSVGDDAEMIKTEIKRVDSLSQPFAALRMDKSIRQALSGQSVDEI